MADTASTKPTKYFVDFENVHGAGLKGVDALDERDEVVVIYSQAAETFHIEQAIDILKSKASIRFVEADAGTRNAADFQLIVALFGDMSEEYDYAIVSGDGGFDAAIKMGERMGLPQVRRIANVRGDIEAEKVDKPKSRRSRRGGSSRNGSKEAAAASVEAVAETENSDREDSADGSGVSKPEPSQSEPKPEPAKVAKEPAKAAKEEKAAKVAKEPAKVTKEEEADKEPAKAAKEEKADKKRVSTREETGEAYARAAEAMRRATEASAASSHSEPGAHAPVTQDASTAQEAPAAKDAPPAKEVPAVQAAPADDGEGVASADAGESQATPKEGKPKKRSRSRGRGKAKPTAEAAETAAAKEVEADTVSATEDASGEAQAAELGEKEAISRVKAILEKEDIHLTDEQLATIASATAGASGRQDFYRRIIKIERQQKGRVLYNQVRGHYAALTEAVRA